MGLLFFHLYRSKVERNINHIIVSDRLVLLLGPIISTASKLQGGFSAAHTFKHKNVQHPSNF